MNKKKTIFQMSLIKNTNNIPGLIFSSELNDYESQFIQFCIPINKKISKINNLKYYLSDFEISMPFSYKNETLNVPAIFNFPYLEFDLQKKIGHNIKFQFEIETFNNKTRRYPIRRILGKSSKFKIHFLRLRSSDFPKLDYFGNWPNINKRNTQFVLLNLIDLKSLNDFYKNYDILPIGGTLNFGLEKYPENKNIERGYEK